MFLKGVPRLTPKVKILETKGGENQVSSSS